MGSRTVGSKSCNNKSDLELRSKGSFFSKGLSFSRTFSRRLQSASVIANLHHWTTTASLWSMRSPPPVISSPVISACNNFGSPPGPTVSQMWYDLSVNSSSMKTSSNSPKVTVCNHSKPPPSPSGKQRYLFKRVGTTYNPKSRNNSNVESEGGNFPSQEDEAFKNCTTTNSCTGDEKFESSDYLTVYVGERSGKRVKYIISKHFLSHHLFQVLLKCSKDEVGIVDDERGGVPIVCDPALFAQLVTVVGASLLAEIPPDVKMITEKAN